VPKHYGAYGITPIQAMEDGIFSKDEYVGFCKGNILKYICRSGLKDGESAVNDYNKAKFYIEKLIQLESD